MRAVDSGVCADGAKCTSDKKSWASLAVGDIVVGPAVDESWWLQGQGDAFSTKPSNKQIILNTSN